MLLSILYLIALPYFHARLSYKSPILSQLKQRSFWFFAFIFIFLGYIGANPPDEPFLTAGRIASFLYFFLLLFF